MLRRTCKKQDEQEGMVYHHRQSFFCRPGQLRKDMVDTCMIDYCNNTDLCRRSLLLKEFDDRRLDSISSLVVNRCECCDVCSKLASL